MPKDKDTLNVRGLTAETASYIKLSAAARAMTLGGYLAALVDLHREMEREGRGTLVARLLDAHGLGALPERPAKRPKRRR